ncbi:autotransporter outer membrane beta-barrel domain-containing protein, partial [Phascolarctobacterium faecium]
VLCAGGLFATGNAEAAAVQEADVYNNKTIDTAYNISADQFNAGQNAGLFITTSDPKAQYGADVGTVDFNGAVNIETSTASALFIDGTKVFDGTLNFNNDLTLKAAAGQYAIYIQDNRGTNASCTLNINPNGKSTVRITGDIYPEISQGGTDRVVNLNLANEQSYWAGDIDDEHLTEKKLNTNLKLSNGAVWYTGKDAYKINTESDDIFTIKSDSGIIDIYHSQPGEARQNKDSGRTFTVNDVDDDFSGANGTTFRIGSNIEAGWSDKIVLNGKAGITGTDQYYIQIVADPSIKSADATIDLASKKIVLAQVDGTNLTKDNTKFTGKTYEGAEIDAGLTIIDLTPELKYDDTSSGWIIDKMKVGKGSSGEKGSALVMAEAGAANSMNIASAWRGENNDLLRRMGDLRGSSDEAGAWVRMYGGENKVSRGQSTNMTYKAVQGGYDKATTLKNGRLFTGFAVSHLDGDASGSGIDGDINSTMFGLYGSYAGNRGHFADLIVKYGRVNSDFNTDKNGNSYDSDYGSNGFSITTEYGYRQNLKDDFYIEPQAELTYSHIGSSDYTMSLNGKEGAAVYNDAFKSLIGRVGFTLGRQQEAGNIYAKLSLAHEFQGDIATQASYGDVTRNYTTGGSDTWIEYGIGFNNQLSKGTNLYGEIERTTGSIVKTKWRANLGLRYSF